MNGKKIGIEISGLSIGDDSDVRVMGIINLSSESFFKASFTEQGFVGSRAREMIDSGATLIDLGGRSTAPGSARITVEEEAARVTNALDALFRECDTGTALVSVDTQYTAVGKAAYAVFARHGKEKYFVLNDVSCLVTDPDMSAWLCDTGAPAIVMASHSVPGDSLGIDETMLDLSRCIEKLDRAGYDTDSRLMIDPAIGKWVAAKEQRFDCELVASLGRFRELGKPILVGISRKSFIGAVLGARDPAERFTGTLSATAIAVYNGAHIVRTHDVTRETMETIRVAQAIRRER